MEGIRWRRPSVLLGPLGLGGMVGVADMGEAGNDSGFCYVGCFRDAELAYSHTHL